MHRNRIMSAPMVRKRQFAGNVFAQPREKLQDLATAFRVPVFTWKARARAAKGVDTPHQ